MQVFKGLYLMKYGLAKEFLGYKVIVRCKYLAIGIIMPFIKDLVHSFI
jgi:hypothetical protein